MKQNKTHTLEMIRHPRQRYITFADLMAKAIWKGWKTETRRVESGIPLHLIAKATHIRTVPHPTKAGEWQVVLGYTVNNVYQTAEYHVRPPFEVGDVVGVRESAWMLCKKEVVGATANGQKLKYNYTPLEGQPIYYPATDNKPSDEGLPVDSAMSYEWKLKTARFVPAVAIRQWIKIKSISITTLRSMGEADAYREGYQVAQRIHQSYDPVRGDALNWFAELWDGINDERGYSWHVPQLVWVYQFARCSADGVELQ